MKHLSKISRVPSQAISIVEFDGILAVFGRTLTALTNTMNFIITALGYPEDLAGVKGGGEDA
jgi:hypothetical protein